MSKIPATLLSPAHGDLAILQILDAEIRRRVPDRLETVVAERCLDAFEFVLDPVRTGRTTLAELDNVEKTFIGLKVEHFIRDLLDAPKGVRDLVLAGHDVDIKNTVGSSWCWMIPPETYRNEEPCIIIASSEKKRMVWMGLVLARAEYLGAKNRDDKRRLKSKSFGHVLWIVNGASWPRDRWAGLDMARFRELRAIKGGSVRAATFFRENLDRPIHRRVIMALLHDQLDPMKRLRENNGAKNLLRPDGIALVSGTYFNPVLTNLGVPKVGNDEFIALHADTADKRAMLQAAGQLD
jgi:hypothetical protein